MMLNNGDGITVFLQDIVDALPAGAVDKTAVHENNRGARRCSARTAETGQRRNFQIVDADLPRVYSQSTQTAWSYIRRT